MITQLRQLLFLLIISALVMAFLHWNVTRTYIFTKQRAALSSLLQTSVYKTFQNDTSATNSNNLTHTLSPELDYAVSVIAKLSNIDNKNVLERVRISLGSLKAIPSFSSYAENVTGLRSTVVPPIAWVAYPETSWYGMTLPVLTATPYGRMGNIMGEYATMYALHKIYNVSVVMSDPMRKRLSGFPHLTIPPNPVVYKKKEWQPILNMGSIYNYAPLELAAAGLLGPGLFCMKETAFEIQLFKAFKMNLKQEFSFSDNVTAHAQTFLHEVANQRKKQGNNEIVFISIHIRRTDYKNHAKKRFGAVLPERSYFLRAMDYYRNKFPQQTVFIAASDDNAYLKKEIGNLSDVFMSSGAFPMMDLAILSSCNHSIVTMGSFGFWSAFLAGGEVVYPDVKYKNIYRFSRKMYESIGLEGFTPLPVD